MENGFIFFLRRCLSIRRQEKSKNRPKRIYFDFDVFPTRHYLLDQILKGRFLPASKILDAGCGRGRNIRWLAQNGFEVYGCDRDPEALVEAIQFTGLTASKFKHANVEGLPCAEEEFDGVICNAVLHFARDEDHFNPNYALELRYEGQKCNKISCFIDFSIAPLW